MYEEEEPSRNKRKSKFGFQFVDRLINNTSGLRGNSFNGKPVFSMRNKMSNIENERLNVNLSLNIDIKEQAI